MVAPARSAARPRSPASDHPVPTTKEIQCGSSPASPRRPRCSSARPWRSRMREARTSCPRSTRSRRRPPASTSRCSTATTGCCCATPAPAPCSSRATTASRTRASQPDGTVEVNTDSKAYYINEERDGQVEVPDGVDGKGEPRWEEVARTGRFEWHDHRMHWMSESDPEAVSDKDVRTKIYDWKVPIAVDGRAGRDHRHAVLDAAALVRPAAAADHRVRGAGHPARHRRGGRPPPPGREAGRGGLVTRALALAVALLALLPAAASAHALLNATTPERGARLDAAPEQVSLRFSEPVEAEFGAVRVFDSSGPRGAGRARLPPGRPRRRGGGPPARRARRGRLHGHVPGDLGRLAPGLRRVRVRGRRRARAVDHGRRAARRRRHRAGDRHRVRGHARRAVRRPSRSASARCCSRCCAGCPACARPRGPARAGRPPRPPSRPACARCCSSRRPPARCPRRWRSCSRARSPAAPGSARRSAPT